VDVPDDDSQVPAFWQSLGLPGLVDLHVHFLPDGVLRKVWAYFDQVREAGVDWRIWYPQPGDGERLAALRALAVRAFPALAYPHKPGWPGWLNEWTAQFAAEQPDCLPSATFFAEPGAGAAMRSALDSGIRIVKSHLQVGRVRPPGPAARRRVGRARGVRYPPWSATVATARRRGASPAPARWASCSPATPG